MELFDWSIIFSAFKIIFLSLCGTGIILGIFCIFLFLKDVFMDWIDPPQGWWKPPRW